MVFVPHRASDLTISEKGIEAGWSIWNEMKGIWREKLGSEKVEGVVAEIEKSRR